MWMNIHCFGGFIEIQTYEGYGARWSGIWKAGDNGDHKDAFKPFSLQPHTQTFWHTKPGE